MLEFESESLISRQFCPPPEQLDRINNISHNNILLYTKRSVSLCAKSQPSRSLFPFHTLMMTEDHATTTHSIDTCISDYKIDLPSPIRILGKYCEGMMSESELLEMRKEAYIVHILRSIHITMSDVRSNDPHARNPAPSTLYNAIDAYLKHSGYRT